MVVMSLAFAGPANSQAAKQRTDPQASSPAGVIYEIPLDSGRRDGAPLAGTSKRSKRGGSIDGAAAGGTGGGIGSAVGAGPDGAGAKGASSPSGSDKAASDGTTSSDAVQPPASPSEGSGPGGGSANDPSSIHSENGFGSSSKVPGIQAEASAPARSSGVGGPASVVGLLSLVGGLAGWVGLRAARTALG